MIRPIDVLLDFLASRQENGQTHIHLDDEARDGLRDLFLRSRKPAARGPAGAVASSAVGISSSGVASIKPATGAPAARSKDGPSLRIEGEGPTERIASLRRQAEGWAPARALGSLRDILVFSTGDPAARLMLVGEAPGYEEERQGEPFVGPAGRKLDDILRAMGLARESVYISNLVKFRPAMPRQTTGNRKPTPEEMASCLPFLLAEIDIVRPSCILCLGGSAGQGLLGLDCTVGAMRGRWHDFRGIPARVTYHPSYLLQSGGGNQVKRQLWEDMLAVMEHLEMPISEKQRGFFLPKAT